MKKSNKQYINMYIININNHAHISKTDAFDYCKVIAIVYLHIFLLYIYYYNILLYIQSSRLVNDSFLLINKCSLSLCGGKIAI